MKLLHIVLIILFGILLVSLMAQSDMPKSQKEVVDRYTEQVLPQGATIIEWVPTKNPSLAYIIFKFRGQCFLQSRFHKQGTSANINCPTKGNP